MYCKKMVISFVAGISLMMCGQVMAIGASAKVLQDKWAVTKYQVAEQEREKAFEALVKEAKSLEQSSPNDAEVLVWEAIILSSYAGEKGGLGALGLVKDAKVLLEKAEKIDGSVLNGSVYTTLGSLYYQVPGWPIGFGNSNKAESYLKKGLAVAPNDIDANYFWADFLMQDERYAEAEQAFQKALAAPSREGRDVADKGRKDEIRTALESLKYKR